MDKFRAKFIVQEMNCVKSENSMPLYRRDLNDCGFIILRSSWNQSAVDIKGGFRSTHVYL